MLTLTTNIQSVPFFVHKYSCTFYEARMMQNHSLGLLVPLLIFVLLATIDATSIAFAVPVSVLEKNVY